LINYTTLTLTLRYKCRGVFYFQDFPGKFLVAQLLKSDIQIKLSIWGKNKIKKFPFPITLFVYQGVKDVWAGKEAGCNFRKHL
jgi:hypothetical protein